MYNLIEPVLLAFNIATSLQIIQIPSTYYLVASTLCVWPMLLLNIPQTINFKKWLMVSILFTAPAVLLMKFWIYYQFTPCTAFYQSKTLQHLFGIYFDRWVHTFIIDILMLPSSALLVSHYIDQQKQLEGICSHTGTLKYQQKLKFLHSQFARVYNYFFTLSITLFFIDSLVYFTAVQLVILIILMFTLYKWTLLGAHEGISRNYTLRTIQGISGISLLVAYFFQYLFVSGDQENEQSPIFSILGIQNEQYQSQYHTRQIIHKIVLTYACVVGEIFFVAKRLQDELNRMKINTQDTAENERKSAQKKILSQEAKMKTSFNYVDLLTALKIPLVLWICRIACLISIYMYHDWQSVILLIWLIHSTIFQDEEKFVSVTFFIYFPLMILNFLFIFTVNIQELVPYNQWKTEPYQIFYPQNPNSELPPIIIVYQNVNMYRYGFYPFSKPHIEMTFNLILVCLIAWYIKLNKEPKQFQKSVIVFLKQKKPLLYDFMQLVIIKSESLILMYGVVYSLSEMDVFHNLILFWYVWYVLNPDQAIKSVRYITCYVGLFILVKYIYTLVPQFNGQTAECFQRQKFDLTGFQRSNLCTNTERIMFTFGFSSHYIPILRGEYFRYVPPYYDWIFLFAAFCQLRRQQFLGTDYERITNETDRIRTSFQNELPKLFKVYVKLDSLFYVLVISVSFIGFLLVLTFIEKSILNLISFLIILSLLFIYLLMETEKLIKYYIIFCMYQAFVLVTQIVCQFVANCLIIYPSVDQWIIGLSFETRKWMWFVGYYQYTQDQLWLKFVPYTVLFFGSVYVRSCIFSKVCDYESNELQLPEKPNINQSDSDPDSQQNFYQDNQDRYQQQLLIYYQTVTKVYYAMMYQDMYKIYKAKFLWPFFFIFSMYFDVIVAIAVLYFAIYFSVSAIWFVFIAIYIVQTGLMHTLHRDYRKKQGNLFKSQGVLNDEAGRFGNSQEQARKLKLQKIIADNQLGQSGQEFIGIQLERIEKINSGSRRIILTDEQALQEYTFYRRDIHNVSLQMRRRAWIFYYIFLLISFAFSYLAVFLDVKSKYQLLNPQQQNTAYFTFYFCGFYQQDKKNQNYNDRYLFIDTQYPYFVLLSLLVLEKLAQLWLANQFNLTDQKVKKYQLIEKTYKQCLKEKDSLLKSRSQLNTDNLSFQNSEQVPNSSQTSTQDQSRQNELQKKRDLRQQLRQLLSIKQQIQVDIAIRVLIDELIVLLIIVLMIYRQNIISFSSYFFVIMYTIFRFRTRRAFTPCRYTVLFCLLTQYGLAVLNMTSYSSNTFPVQVMGLSNVYPNTNKTYFGIPLFFDFAKNFTTVADIGERKIVKLSTLHFYSIDLQNQPLNGLWIDFIITVLFYLQLTRFNCWLVAEPHKIIPSEKTRGLLIEYDDLDATNQQNWYNSYQALKTEVAYNRYFKAFTEIINMNFTLLLLAFILIINVFTQSLIAQGYLVFSIILIVLNLSFFKDIKYQDAQVTVIQYFLIPYLLVEILSLLISAIPIELTKGQQVLQDTIGTEHIWQYSPNYLYLGEEVQISLTRSPKFSRLVVVAIVYFMSSLQLWIQNSQQFQKFSTKVILDNLENRNKIGLGMAYRFNNFKNKQLIKQATTYDQLEKMLKHVKKLIIRREILYRVQQVNDQGQDQNQLVELRAQQFREYSQTQERIKRDDRPPEIFYDADGIGLEQIDSQELRQQREQIIDFAATYNKEIKELYEKSKKQLSVMHKIYLWLQRNYVQDILFRISEDHLDDMIKQFKQGRTSIETTLEIGLMTEIKLRWFDKKEEELKKQIENDEISRAVFDNFEDFKKSIIKKLTLKPWQRYDPENLNKKSYLFKLYLVLIGQIISSNTHIICYLFMILAVIKNGGLIYMMYPALVFGIALLEEDKPGKKLWFFVVYYTSALLVLQFLTQLTIWTNQYQNIGHKIYNYQLDFNIGIILIPQSDYNNVWTMIWYFTPEIGIIVSILILIKAETLSGIFDISLSQYESFSDGLQRTTTNIISQNKKAKQGFDQLVVQQLVQQTVKNGIDVELNRLTKRFRSEFDILEMPDLIKQRNEFIKNMQQKDDSDLQTQLSKFPIFIDQSVIRQRSRSFDLDNFNGGKRNISKSIKFFISQWSTVFWRNKYFDRLFPQIKQQKPGKDYYVGIAGFGILICFYLVIFYNGMITSQSTVADQVANTQFKGPMVLALFVMLGIVVIDRILYSSYAFQSSRATSERLNLDSPITQNDTTNISDDRSSNSSENILRQNNLRDTMITTSENEQNQQQFENQVAFSDKQKRAFQDILTPQKRDNTISTVFRYYFLWVVLILVHWYIFFALVSDKKSCKTIKYCNKFNQNWYLKTFYILFCFYFTLCAKQIQSGLPELRNGGFLLNMYNSVGQYIFEAWYEIPFLFELRTIIDWTFTATALDVFQSIKLAQIQAAMQVARCENKTYMLRPLGMKQQWFKKIFMGFTLLIFALALIAGPMLLFSTLNPVATSNPVIGGNLQFYILIEDLGGTSTEIPIFQTRQLIQNQTIPQDVYNGMNFNNINFQTSQFQLSQTQAVQFSPVSDSVWGISPPKKTFLIQSLIQALNGTNPNQTVQGVLRTDFNRQAVSASSAQLTFSYPLNTTTPLILSSLINQIQYCDNGSQQSTSFPSNSIQITIGLDSTTNPTDLLPPPSENEQSQYYYAGFDLTYYCDSQLPSNSYWNLTQTYSANDSNIQGAQIQTNEDLVFNTTGGYIGFGYFAFNQNVLPSYLAKYQSSVLLFYVGVIYLIASQFRLAFVPFAYMIYIIDAPFTHDILKICQCIYIYRVQRSHQNEEELYHILIDIMRSPEMVKQICGSSLKKKLE